MKYLLDSNILMEAYNRYYTEKIVPSFWNFVKKDEDIFTIKEVMDEIKKKSDGLYELVKSIKIKNNFNPSVATQISAYIKDNYMQAGAENFLRSNTADYPLICIAHENKMTLVTHEITRTKPISKVRIPNICAYFTIPCINTRECLEAKNVCLGGNYHYYE